MVFCIGFTGTHVTREVSYDELRSGEATSAATVESGEIRLLTVTDPADEGLGMFSPEAGARYVAFTISIRNAQISSPVVTASESVLPVAVAAAVVALVGFMVGLTDPT